MHEIMIKGKCDECDKLTFLLWETDKTHIRICQNCYEDI